jgi:hypothetical protein
MVRRRNASKSFRRNSPKHLLDKSAKRSVTAPRQTQRPNEKKQNENGPHRQGERLAPWLALANGTAKSPFRFAGVVFDLTSNIEPLQRSVRATFERLVIFAEVLRVKDPTLLERYRHVGAAHAATFHVVWELAGADFWGDLALGLDGRLTDNPSNLRGLFVEALRETEVQRFKRCPICEQFFYAVRADRRESVSRGDKSFATKTCSKRCRGTLRVRNWREKQSTYELNRKFKSAGVRPEGKDS